MLQSVIRLVDVSSSRWPSTRTDCLVSYVFCLCSCRAAPLTGFKNAQISKLWSATHWKNDACRLYWKDVHLVCVRKYRPSASQPTFIRCKTLVLMSWHPSIFVCLRTDSTYAAYEEVSAITGDKYAYLHELPPTVSPLRRVSIQLSNRL